MTRASSLKPAGECSSGPIRGFNEDAEPAGSARCWCRQGPGRCRASDLISGGVQYIVAGYSMSEFDLVADQLSKRRLEFHPAPGSLETSCAQEKLDAWGTDTRTIPAGVQGRGRPV